MPSKAHKHAAAANKPSATTVVAEKKPVVDASVAKATQVGNSETQKLLSPSVDSPSPVVSTPSLLLDPSVDAKTKLEATPSVDAKAKLDPEPMVDAKVKLDSTPSVELPKVEPKTEEPKKVDPRRAMLEKHLLDSGRATTGGTSTWTDVVGSKNKDGVGPGKKLTISGGGPNELIRNKKSSEVLHGMERAINQNKVGDKLAAKGKTPEEIHALMETPTGGDKISPEDVAKSEGVDTNFAHFVGRHGAGEAVTDPSLVKASKKKARDEQIGRVLTGTVPDHMSHAPVDTVDPTTSLTDKDGNDVTLPNVTKAGDDLGVASGGFSSHTAQLFAIEEGLSAAWNRKSSVKDKLTTATSFDHTTSTTVAGDPSQKGKLSKPHQVQTVVPTTEDQEISKSGRYAVGVNLPHDPNKKELFEGGFGESFSLDKAYGKDHKLTEGMDLTPSIMQERLDNTTSTTDQKGAAIILDEDNKRGGFNVQTAYPVNTTGGKSTQSQVSTAYKGEVTKARKTDKFNKTTETKKNASTEVTLPQVLGSDIDEEIALKQRLAKIPDTKKK